MNRQQQRDTRRDLAELRSAPTGPLRLADAGPDRQVLRAEIAADAPIGQLVLSVNPLSGFASLGNGLKVRSADINQARLTGDTIYAIKAPTSTTVSSQDVEWWEIPQGEGSSDNPHYITKLDAALAADDTSASLTGAIQDIVPVGTNALPDPLPVNASNVFALAGAAGDLATVRPTLATAWAADTDYGYGSFVYRDPGSGVRLYVAPAAIAGAATFQVGWTDLGDYVHRDYWLVGFVDKIANVKPFRAYIVSNIQAAPIPISGSMVEPFVDVTMYVTWIDGEPQDPHFAALGRWFSRSTRTIESGRALVGFGVIGTDGGYNLTSVDCDDDDFSYTPPS